MQIFSCPPKIKNIIILPAISENSLPNRWNFIQGDHNSAGFLASNSTKSKSTKLVRGSRLSMQKRMLHHRQKLMDLQQAQKTFFSNHPDKSSQNSSNTLLKQQEKEFKKELSKYASKVDRFSEIQK